MGIESLEQAKAAEVNWMEGERNFLNNYADQVQALADKIESLCDRLGGASPPTASDAIDSLAGEGMMGEVQRSRENFQQQIDHLCGQVDRLGTMSLA